MKRRSKKSSARPAEFRLPRSVAVAGKTFRVEILKDAYDCDFTFDTQTIRIGLKGKTNEALKECLLHEIAEGIFADRLMRYKLGYSQQENGHLLFNFNHNQFEMFISDLAVALRGLSF